ncbi:TrmH family RNA methyltransferase [Patescibacteria group bacterium]|nr:TrmH family RNA methyltransferase [Patescibacteria group bacterium]
MFILHVIANDIRSCENVGALMRTCEFLGVKKLWLTGYTPAPPDAKVLKTSLGAETSLSWEKRDDVSELMDELKKQNFELVGLEIDERAKELSKYSVSKKVALLLGNEVSGISPSLLEKCDDVVMIKPRGKKESLNVTIAAAIACWSMLK